MLQEMDTYSDAPQEQKDENEEDAFARRQRSSRRQREKQFFGYLGSLAQAAIKVAIHIYATLEDIKEGMNMENVEIGLTELSEKLDQIEAVDETIQAGVKTAGERFTELAEEIKNLPVEGGSVTKEQVEALSTKAEATLTGLTQAASTLTEETPAESSDTPSGPTTDEKPKPNKSTYVFTNTEDDPDLTQWTASGFETTDTPPIKLYYFNGDSGPGETNGAGVGAWTLYTGDVQEEAPQA